MFNVKSSIVRFTFIAVELIVSPLIRIWLARGWNCSLPRTALPFCVLLHTVQLMLPVPLERAGPLVQWPDRLRVHSVHHPASLPAYVHQSNVQQHPQMLRDRRLLQFQRRHYLAPRPLLPRQIVQDLAPPGLGDCVERVRRCSRSSHAHTIHSYMGICQAIFFRSISRVGMSRLQTIEASLPSIWLTGGVRFLANVMFEVFIQVLPYRAERLFIVLQSADQQRAFQRANDQLR